MAEPLSLADARALRQGHPRRCECSIGCLVAGLVEAQLREQRQERRAA